MAGKTYIKTGDSAWDRVKKIYLKTGGQTWSSIRKAYIKTGESTWKKVYDTASNRPYIRGNDIPKIRLNTYRTNSTSSGAVNPVVEAPPVQQMGPPTTTPTTGWPNETIGNYLWGYDGDWVSGNGSSMTFTYKWYYNLTGNQNDNVLESAATSSSWDDRLTNNSTYLGQSDGDYFDRNFLTFKVTATNSAGAQSSDSAQVYIVRQRPTGSITMIEPDIASPNTTMSATFEYSNSWYNKADTTESYVEWFAVDNLGDALTTSNRVQNEALNTFSPTGTTTKTATTYHVPTLTNKYYYVRITLNNSNTLPAEFAGSTINVSGFTPNSAFTASANKTAKTATANGPFNLTNAVKTERYTDAGGNFKRYVSVDIGQSSSATQYEVQIEGQYSGVSGIYDTSSSSWTVLQSLDAAAYVYESSRINGSLVYTKDVLNYKNYRLTARSRNGTSLNGAAYSNNGTSGSYVYVTAPSVASSAPSISNIATSSDFFGSYITFDNYIASNGSNSWDYFEYSLDNGSTWSLASSNSGYINTTQGKLYATSGSSVNLRIRLTNLDGATSSQSNLLSITVAAQPTAPTSVVVKSFTANEGTIFFTSGSNTQSVEGFLEYDSFNQFDSISGYINVGSSTAAKIQLTGANSTTRSYTAYLRPYSGQNKTGGSGTITSYTTKVLNGSDVMSVTVGSPTLGSDARTINVSWSSTGSPTLYTVDLYYYNSPYTILSTKTTSSTSISFTSSDGVNYSTVYYVRVTPRYEYTSSVYYDGSSSVSSNITTGANLSAPTPTSVSFTSPSTFNVYFSGGSGPYYQLWWATTTGTISGSSFAGYDAAGTGSPITESLTGSAGSTYYFWVRSSTENLGNTTQSGTATSGTYSPWSSSYVSYTVPSNATAPTSVSASANSSSSITVFWSGATNATKYRVWYSTSSTGNAVDPSASYDAETTGTSVTFNSLSSSTTYYFWVSASGDNNVWTPYSSSPRGQATTLGTAPSTPTGVSASTTRTDGVLISWNASSGATSYEIWWGGPPLDSYSPDFYPGNTTSYLDTGISAGSSRTYYVRARNANGASSWSSGATGTRVSAPSGTAPSTPTGLSNSYSSGPSWTGSWSASSGTATITYYWTLYQSQSNGGSITATASGSTTGTSFSRSMSSSSGLWAYFTVYASNSYGTSGTATSSWA